MARTSPRQISVRGETYYAIRLKAQGIDKPVGRLVDQLITNYLDRLDRVGEPK